ncbi:hypothetical protein BASA81_002642 [Batrachochytrium salamandrivorans]|nr:hypothetical protein BASA81_002642 [Batrachochytrium salamandrivorans]
MPIAPTDTATRRVGRPPGARNLTPAERAAPNYGAQQRERKNSNYLANKAKKEAEKEALISKLNELEEEGKKTRLLVEEAGNEARVSEREHYEDELHFVRGQLLDSNSLLHNAQAEIIELKKCICDLRRRETAQRSRLDELPDELQRPKRARPSWGAVAGFAFGWDDRE